MGDRFIFWTMLKPVLLAGAVLFAISAHAQDDVVTRMCPKLPTSSGFKWEFKDGPDFYVCYAKRSSPSPQLIGVYIGNHPDFQPEKKARLKNGKVGNNEVTWYRKSTSDSGFQVGLETVFALRSPPFPNIQTFAHVWAFSFDEASLTALLTLLEGMSFEHLKHE